MTCDYFFGSKFLRGNDDRNSEKKHVVYGVLAKQLRFRPRTHQAGVCMRTEVFGVKKNPSEFEASMHFLHVCYYRGTSIVNTL